MLPKELRLNKKKEFDLVFKKGKAAFNESAGIKAVKNSLEVSRFGFIVSGKVSKKAVERNKVKRRMREIIRTNISALKTGYDVVIIAQKKSKNVDFAELKASLQQNLSKLKLFK